MKQILVENCKGCPYSDFCIRRVDGEDKIYYKCEHSEIKQNEWTDGEEFPEYCPLD